MQIYFICHYYIRLNMRDQITAQMGHMHHITTVIFPYTL